VQIVTGVWFSAPKSTKHIQLLLQGALFTTALSWNLTSPLKISPNRGFASACLGLFIFTKLAMQHHQRH